MWHASSPEVTAMAAIAADEPGGLPAPRGIVTAIITTISSMRSLSHHSSLRAGTSASGATVRRYSSRSSAFAHLFLSVIGETRTRLRARSSKLPVAPSSAR